MRGSTFTRSSHRQCPMWLPQNYSKHRCTPFSKPQCEWPITQRSLPFLSYPASQLAQIRPKKVAKFLIPKDPNKKNPCTLPSFKNVAHSHKDRGNAGHRNPQIPTPCDSPKKTKTQKATRFRGGLHLNRKLNKSRSKQTRKQQAQ